jgi:uncharacterized repeat protein (TIGR03803 family)
MRLSNPTPISLILTILIVTLMLANAAWAAVPEKVLVSINGTSGNEPNGLSMDAAGNLWGVTLVGGTGNCPDDEAPLTGCGTVFELTPTSSGWNYKVIYSFQAGHDGWGPKGQLAFDAAGNVYGITIQGGGSVCSYGCGVVYKLTPESGRYKESVIYRFNPTRSHNDGELPMGGLVMDAAGNLYGTTYQGGDGCTSSCGTVFELSPATGGAWTESIIYNFKGGDSGDGAWLFSSLLLDGEGNLYGTASQGGTGDCGGGIGGCGVVFELSPSSGGWSESILYDFQGGAHDGTSPESGLIFDAAGNLYGTTLSGGGLELCNSWYGCGIVFELSPAGGSWTESVIHIFSLHEGQNPNSGLVIGSTGNLYGVTPLGGVADWGTAFELASGSGGLWTESILHNFGNGSDAAVPITPLIFGSDGNLYGASILGGAHVTGPCLDSSGPPNGCGTVFQLTP